MSDELKAELERVRNYRMTPEEEAQPRDRLRVWQRALRERQNYARKWWRSPFHRPPRSN